MEAAESFGRFGWVFGAISELLQDGHNYALSAEVRGGDSENRPLRLYLFDTASYTGVCLTPLEPLELPVCGYHSSSDLAQDYNWMSSLLSAWHLFETLDLRRNGAAETSWGMVDGTNVG